MLRLRNHSLKICDDIDFFCFNEEKILGEDYSQKIGLNLHGFIGSKATLIRISFGGTCVWLSATERLKNGVFKQPKRRSVEIDRGDQRVCISRAFRHDKLNPSRLSRSLCPPIEESEDF